MGNSNTLLPQLPKSHLFLLHLPVGALFATVKNSTSLCASKELLVGQQCEAVWCWEKKSVGRKAWQQLVQDEEREMHAAGAAVEKQLQSGDN